MIALLNKISTHRITVKLVEGKLKLYAENNQVDPLLLKEIKENKEALIKYLAEEAEMEAAAEAYEHIPAIEEGDDYEVSYSQNRMWMTSQSEAMNITYNLPLTVELTTITKEIITKAMKTLVARHEVLRTCFFMNASGELRQKIVPHIPTEQLLTYIDLSKEEAPEQLANTYISQDVVQPFDLAKAPLFRAVLLQLGDQKAYCYFNIHHSISDGWSLMILKKELYHLCQVYQQGEESNLPPLRIQYKDVAHWQNKQINSGKYAYQKDYWLQKLGGELPTIALPTEKTRPNTKTYKGEFLSTIISKENTQMLKEFCNEQQGSLFTGLLAVTYALLAQYATQDDIIIGTPVSGREHNDVQDQVGCFVNTLALRNQVDLNDNFIEFYTKIKESVLTDFEHQAYPFDKILEELEIRKDISRNPIFDTLFILQNFEQATEIAVSDADVGTFTREKSYPKCDLDIEFKNLGDYLVFRIHYNTDVYEGEMIEGFMKHFSVLLTKMLQQKTTSIGTLEFIAQKEKQKILFDFNDTEVTFPIHKTMIELFNEQAARCAEKTAITFQEIAFTYAEVDEAACQLANYLTQQGIQSQDFVGIMYERSAEMVIAMLAILKVGAVYVPISLEYPEDRIEHIIKDSKLKLILTNTAKVPLTNTELVHNIHDIVDELKSMPTTITLPNLKPTDLINCLYTSGSTGKPKGVLLTHEGLVNYIHTVYKDSDVTPDSKYLQFSNISFDAAGQSIYTSLCFGLSLYIRNDEEVDPEKLHQLITKHNITHAVMTTSYFVSYVNYLSDENIGRQLTCFCIGGERLNKHSILKNLDKIKILTKKLLNLYGPTEATLTQTMFSILEDEQLHQRSTIPIGKPRANRSVLILDKYRKVVPVGVQGELCIGGVGLARAYLNRPDLTAEKFIPHPYNQGERLYRSGDLAKWLPDGNIEFIGRNDEQVKIRGFRMELREIEEAILTHPKIVKAVVLVHEDKQDKQLVAYYETIIEESNLDVKEYLASKLPVYMIPTLCVEVEKFESNVNGKIDTKKLPKPNLIQTVSVDDVIIPPETEKEKILVAAWKHVLKYENISTTHDFFSLGGDSIKSIQLISYVKNNGHTIRLEQILQAPTLKNMAVYLEQNIQQTIEENSSGEALLTPIQRMFFNTQTHSLHQNNQAVLLLSKQRLEATIIDQCFAEIVKHHDTLRLRYKKENTTWTQYYHDAVAKEHYTLSVHDLQQSEKPLEEMSSIGQQLQETIDIENGPLVQLAIFKLPDADRLAIIIHHLIIDGVSWRILLDDLMSLYTKFKTGNPLYLPYKTNSYQQWGTVQQAYVQQVENREEKLYWKAICEQEILKLPQDALGNATWNTKLSHTFSEEITSQLKTKIHSLYKIDIKEVLLTSVGLAIQEVLGVAKTAIKMEGHGRVQLDDTMDFSRTLGWFTTIYPFIVNVDPTKTLLENVYQTKQQFEDIPNDGIGYGIFKHLTDEFESDIDTSIVFNYLGDFDNILSNDEHVEFSFSSESIGKTKKDNPSETNLLNIEGIIVNGQLSISVEYAKELYHQETIQKILDTTEKSILHIVESATTSTPTFKLPQQKSAVDMQKFYRKLPWAVFSNYNYVSESAPNYIVIHDGNGELFGYRLFFEAIKTSHNIWGIVMDKDVLAPNMVTTEEMAETYSNIIEGLFDDHDNIELLGWSYGGYISYQMAHHFEKKKRAGFIKSIIMVDTMDYIDTNYDAFYKEAFFEKNRSLTLANEKALVKTICPQVDLEQVNATTVKTFWEQIGAIIMGSDYDFTIPPYWAEHFKKLYPNVDIFTAFKKINQLRTIGLNLPVPYKKSVKEISILYIKAASSDSSHQRYWEELTEAPFEAIEVEGRHGALMEPPYLDGVVQSITKTKILHN